MPGWVRISDSQPLTFFVPGKDPAQGWVLCIMSAQPR